MRRPRVVRGPHEAHDGARELARWICAGEAALHQVDVERRQERDADPDRGRVELGELGLDEGPDPPGVILWVFQRADVGR